VKVALPPSVVAELGKAAQSLDGARLHLSAGGNLAFVSLGAGEQAGEFDERLRMMGLSGVTLRGEAPLWLGARGRPAIALAVKQALDPMNRFPSLDD
jgi:hypothetical protein